ncbi:MAG: AbrB/MazE/SpoVT family DNA-binding domain-containing protein [Gammaproteobacteria bacterium]|nr:AbrB/MazE/SpoVT family DNA-binding domain-containing protein [Gammaproteobacteria bacterium]
MLPERYVSLFRNGRNQALRIPREFELPARKAIIRKDGDKLIIEPVRTDGLLTLLASLENIETTFPEMDEALLPPDHVEL